MKWDYNSDFEELFVMVDQIELQYDQRITGKKNKNKFRKLRVDGFVNNFQLLGNAQNWQTLVKM